MNVCFVFILQANISSCCLRGGCLVSLSGTGEFATTVKKDADELIHEVAEGSEAIMKSSSGAARLVVSGGETQANRPPTVSKVQSLFVFVYPVWFLSCEGLTLNGLFVTVGGAAAVFGHIHY